MALGDVLRSRLAVRIYLVGLAQIAAVTLGFVMFHELNRPLDPSQHEAEERRLAMDAAKLVDQPEALQERVAQARAEHDIIATIIDPAGKVVASSAPADAPPCAPPPGPPREPPHGPPPLFGPHDHPPPGPLCRVMAIVFPNGDYGRIELRRERPPPPPSPFSLPVIVLTLVVVGVSSYFLAHSLGRPLRQLGDAARKLGAGDLGARTDVKRSDELGDVARAFDDMAARVTELVHAEKELVANVSHELRTPLARIRVALDIAGEGDAATARESLADIAGDLEELERLVSDVLLVARLDIGSDRPRGIPPLRIERVDLGELAKLSAARFRQAHPERALEVTLDDALPAIDGDAVLLRRVIDNLLDNAHKYTEAPDAPIALTARAADDGAIIEVIDRGIGIASQDLSGVFAPFFRVDRSRTRTTGGLGLGLALVKRIVEAHRGTIALDSAPGEGTTARVFLPA